MKKNRGDEIIGVIIHLYKETPCVAILNKQKCHLFSSTKSENRRVEQVLPGGGWYQ
jgi:hypothetical protein